MYKSAYILPHPGLGDIITVIGAINYFLLYYETITILCDKKFVSNVELLINNMKVKILSFEKNKEIKDCKNIINKILNEEKTDIFICGSHKKHFVSKIENPNIKSFEKTNKYIEIWNHVQPPQFWDHLRYFYNDMNLDLTIYFEYFDIKSSDNSLYYYNKVKNLKIIFCHTKSSRKTISIPPNILSHINDDNYLIICANQNVYKNTHKYYTLVNEYVNLQVQYYIDIIKNACEIYVIDSCFSCIIHPLYVCNKLKTQNVKIIARYKTERRNEWWDENGNEKKMEIV